jgi:hypothetical protein
MKNTKTKRRHRKFLAPLELRFPLAMSVVLSVNPITNILVWVWRRLLSWPCSRVAVPRSTSMAYLSAHTPERRDSFTAQLNGPEFIKRAVGRIWRLFPRQNRQSEATVVGYGPYQSHRWIQVAAAVTRVSKV